MSPLHTRAAFCQGVSRRSPLRRLIQGLNRNRLPAPILPQIEEPGLPERRQGWPCPPPRPATDLSIWRGAKKSPAAAQQTEQWP
ncbi:MAG: hypothetical protein KME26_04480 [Oscillatoria princeps RMCB-10]|nr:hypothetical protein [Oscillatoria princeps RMCB-10]